MPDSLFLKSCSDAQDVPSYLPPTTYEADNMCYICNIRHEDAVTTDAGPTLGSRGASAAVKIPERENRKSTVGSEKILQKKRS